VHATNLISDVGQDGILRGGCNRRSRDLRSARSNGAPSANSQAIYSFLYRLAGREYLADEWPAIRYPVRRHLRRLGQDMEPYVLRDRGYPPQSADIHSVMGSVDRLENLLPKRL
jgi:hypothetical protein